MLRVSVPETANGDCRFWKATSTIKKTKVRPISWTAMTTTMISYEGKGACAATAQRAPGPGEIAADYRLAESTGGRLRQPRPLVLLVHAGIPQAEKAREAWYVLDVTACHTAGGISIRSSSGKPRWMGNSGKLKPLTIDRTGVDRFPLPEDRESLRLLLACRRDSG